MEGILIVNKPKGLTSHGVVEFIRNKFKIKRVGHAGTLDPLATGVLIILIGKATKLFSTFVNFDKEYEATLVLGGISDTGDAEGKIIKRLPYDNITEEQISRVFSQFKGKITQVPPMVSAIKHKGRRLYELARKGLEVPRRARAIEIYDLQIKDVKLPEVLFHITCSKGTYIRALAQDIGKRLGCGAFISEIHRLRCGPFPIKDASALEEINAHHLRHWQT